MKDDQIRRSAAVVNFDGSRGTGGRTSVTDMVQRYWAGLRGDRLVPLRSEIDPRGIQGALDCAFIVERIAPGIVRFRLAGSHLVDLMGAEVRGMPLSVLFAAEARETLSEAVEAVFSGPETLRLSLAAERGLGRPALVADMVLLPLKSDLGDITRAIGCLSSKGPVGRAPRRLTITSVQRTDLLDGRPTVRALAPPAPAEADPIPAAQTLRPVPGAPHLSVVEPAG